MTHETNRRNLRTFIATLLAYVLLTSQLAPVAMAFSGSAGRRAPAPTPDTEREKTSEAPQQESVAGSFAPVPVPLRVTALGSGPVTATKVDSFPDPDGDGKVSPGENITYSVTITNNTASPISNVTLNDTVDPNTTLIGGSAVSTPIGFDDAFNVVGNVRIQPNAAQGLLANDINPNTGNNTGLTASGPATSTQGGDVVINADGSFSYNPPAGFTGSDTFTYTVTSPNGTDTATATLIVGDGAGGGSNVIWFVNSAAPAGGDGRLTNPFNCLVGAGCYDPVAADEAGDTIFLFNGSYTGGLTFFANQKLVGQGATATLASLAGVTPPAYSDALPATNSTPSGVTITAAANALTVNAGGILLRGFTVGNTTGAKIFGSSFGALTAGNSASPDLILNGTGKALDLTNGSFVATSGFSSVATTSSGSQGISLTTVTGTVSFGSTTVSGSTTQGILVGTTTADINFGNTSITGGTDGISLQNNPSGTRTFGTLSASGGSANAFLHGAGGGNVTVGGAATLSSAGDAISVSAPTNTSVINFQAATSATRTSAGGNGVNWTGTAGATMTFSALTIQTNAGTGLNATVGGTINVTNGTGTINNTVQAAPAIVANGVALNANFSAINSSGGTSGVSLTNVTGTSNFGGGSLSGASGATFLVSGGTVSTTFSGGITQANNAPMVSIGGGHTTGTITFQTGTLSATNGTGLQFDNADSTTSYNFNGTTTLNGGDAGIDIINGSAGTFNFGGTTITNPTGVALNVDGSSVAVTGGISISGAISKNNNGVLVDCNNYDTGTATLSGNLSCSSTCDGIEVTNNGASSGTVNFSGGTKTLNTSASIAVNLDNNDGGTVNFTGGGLDIDTTTGTGFNAINGGTVTVQGSNNTINSGTGTAMNIAGTTIGASGVTFLSISANGAANGVVLNGTGSNGLTVTGTDGGDAGTDPDAGTGGTIQNVTDNGVSLTNANNVSLGGMTFNNSGSHGINVNGGSNLTLNGTQVINAGNADNEFGLNISNTTGSVILSLATFNNAADNLVYVTTTGSLNFTVSNSSNFSYPAGISGTANSAILIEPSVSGAVTASIQNSTFTNIVSASAQIGANTLNANGTQNFTFSNNTINVTLPARGSGITVSGQELTTTNITIDNNNFSGAGGNGVVSIDTNDTSTVKGTVSGNTITNPPGIGIFVAVDEAGKSDVTLDGNTITNSGGDGIQTVNFGGAGVSTMDMIITNNMVNGHSLNTAVNFVGGIVAFALSAPPEAGDSICVVLRGNTVTGTPAGLTQCGGAPCVDYYLEETAGVMTLEEVPNTGNTTANAAYVNSINDAGPVTIFGIIDLTNGASCNLVLGPVTAGSTGPSDLPNKAEAGMASVGNSRLDANLPIPSISASTAASMLPWFAAPAAEIIQVSRTASAERNPFSLGTSAKRDGGATFNYAVAGTSAPLAQTQTRRSQDKRTQGGGGKPDTPSTSGSTPQQTGGPAKPAVQSPTPGVVVDPGLRYIPKPRPVAPPVGGGLPPVIVGNNLFWNVGTLPAGQSVTITFQVTVNLPPPTFAQVSNQGMVTADGGINVLTDDPDVAGANNPTITGVTVPPDLFVRDARVAEPTSGSTPMIFTLALSTPAPAGGIVVNLSTANDTATGGTCLAGDDYATVTGGTATFAAGEQIKTFPVTVCSDAIVEGDETFFLNVNSAPAAVIVDGQGLGTITAANAPGTILISELRTSGPGGAGDDFVEIYNNTDTPHTVPAGGYGLFKRGASCDALPVLIGTIPAATVIPQRGHYLFVGSTYSLTAYAGGNAPLTTDIESDFNVGLFSTVDPLAISTANRLDAVGFGISTGGVCDLLLEGTTLQPASGSTSEHSFVREFTLVGNDVPTPTDGNDNAADFTVVSTTPGAPVGSNAAPRLGAPGPENLAGPNLKKFSQVGALLLDQTQPASGSRNRVRDLTVVPNGALGTLSIRRRFTNNTGAPITRLRFRIYDITTSPSPPGTADLRALTSVDVAVSGVMDAANCTANGTPATPPCTVTAFATTLEQPPNQTNGGGLNSSMAAGVVTMTPLANGASVNVQFLFGVQQSGGFRVFVFVEALP